MKILPTLAEVKEFASAAKYNVLPVNCEILSDFTTPIETMKILKNVSTHCYLLESAKDLIGTSVSALKAEGEKVLGSFMDGIAKLIIRTILLPIFMLLVYLGIVRTAFSMLGIRDGAGAGTPSHRVLRRKLKGFKHSGTGVSQ